jgi:thiaminase
MADDLTALFLKKVIKLEQNVAGDVLNCMQYITELRQWLVSDRYITQHKTCQAFMTYLFNQSEGFKNRDAYVSWLKCKVGFADIQTTEAVIDAQKVIFKKYLPWSLSFGSCSQKDHAKFLEDIKQFAMRKYKIDFDKWLEEYTLNPELVQ